MMRPALIAGVVAWYVLGLVGAGFVVAESIEDDRRFRLWTEKQRAEKAREAVGFGLLWAIFGPIALVLGFVLTGFGQYGWWGYRGASRGER